jgi:hypothetical protein
VSENNIRLCYNKLYPRRFFLVPEAENWTNKSYPNQVSMNSMANYFNKRCSYVTNLVKTSNIKPEMIRLWKEVIGFLEIWDILKLKLVSKRFYKLI